MKVLLIDDHPLILPAVQSVISGLAEDVQVFGAVSVESARDLLAQHRDIELILLDLYLGQVSGHDVLIELRGSHPSIPVVVVSASDRPSDMLRCIDNGAMGYVPKRASNHLLFEALHLVMSGGIYIPPVGLAEVAGVLPAVAADDSLGPISADSMTAALDGGMPYPDPHAGLPGGHAARPAAGALPVSIEALGLTPRQTEVLVLLLQGQPNKAIARELGLSVETVKDHVAAVLRSLGVSSRTQAVLAVSQLQTHGATSLRNLRA
jgi:DNA-binding NarL/FixJ family response regulator